MDKRVLAYAVTTVAVASVGLGVPASAAVTLHPDGTGFVDRSEVLQVLDWTNARLQAAATETDFVAETVTVTATSWTCADGDTGSVAVLERRTTTTATADLMTSVERSARTGAVTGFGLLGPAGEPVTVAVVEGPEPGSCPAGRSAVPGSTGTVGTAGPTTLRIVHGGQEHALPSGRAPSR